MENKASKNDLMITKHLCSQKYPVSQVITSIWILKLARRTPTSLMFPVTQKNSFTVPKIANKDKISQISSQYDIENKNNERKI